MMKFALVKPITTVGGNLAVGVDNNNDTFFSSSIPYDLVFEKKRKNFDR